MSKPKLLLPSQSDRPPGELVLPGALGNRRNATGLTIYVPRGHEDSDVYITGVCHWCGARFERKGEEAAWQKHTAMCGAKHLDEIRAEAPSEKKRGTIWDPNEWDPEVEEHLRKVGKQMIKEGRMEVRPSERAGF